MTLTLELPDELTQRLQQAAAARGMDLAGYLRPVLEAAAPATDEEAISPELRRRREKNRRAMALLDA